MPRSLAGIGVPPVRLAGMARLVHPFPSVLDGLVVLLVALVAGASVAQAALLGVSMALLQFAIGALNDIVDAPRDVARAASKPIPGGLVTLRNAWIAAGASGALGVTLALAGGGPGLAALAIVVLGIGAAYDLVAKGTTLSWLPLALGIPLLPGYGWFGAAGALPGVFVVLVPAAANAGTALAIANAVVDVERDEAAGTGSIAVALGAWRASVLVVVLHGVVAALSVGTAAVLGAPSGWLVAVILAAGIPLSGALLGLVATRRVGPALRELAWEVQAIGTALLAVAWLVALSASDGGVAGR